MTKLKIILIDDSSSANLYHNIMMEDAGINVSKSVTQFISSVEAKKYLLEIYQSNRISDFPTTILLDINIPVINGWQLVEFLEGLNLDNQAPEVFMVSNSRSPKDLLRAKEHSIVTDILEKHVEVDFFEALINRRNNKID